VRTLAAVAVIPTALLGEAGKGAMTVAPKVTPTRTRSTSMRTIATFTVIPVALLVEAAEVANGIIYA
jgi:hypothetical protein